MPSARTVVHLVDFSGADVMRSFRVINDGVMGGASTSRLRSTGRSTVFEGEVSLANNGGFASCRGPVAPPTHATTLLVTARGDGRRYKLTLKLDDRPDTFQYQAAFVAPRDWETLRFVPSDFTASFRGRPLDAPALQLPRIRQLGVLIADRQAGAFGIELSAVDAECAWPS